ncbi:hypothetical protein F751_6765 [Auxenochlorella protothecoides]|uniref:Uncharacterized protein n=1 Tax=Auxenochlorella protothecoides TaxID=3075 RepID=A0A087SDJ3_AUXPR|nr:hypothetical protein F751_6765 [Auxenochlorella protothecoides]KFM23797.1 hypothetical protein F751_6765 [Auxenochlorella protothecoides]
MALTAVRRAARDVVGSSLSELEPLLLVLLVDDVELPAVYRVVCWGLAAPLTHETRPWAVVLALVRPPPHMVWCVRLGGVP